MISLISITRKSFRIHLGGLVLVSIALTGCGGGGRSPDTPPPQDTTPPYLVSSNISEGAVDVPVNTKISFTMSEAVECDNYTTIGNSRYPLPCTISDPTSPFLGTETINGAVVEFIPNPPLVAYTHYKLRLHVYLTDLSGNRYDPCALKTQNCFSLNFSTGSADGQPIPAPTISSLSTSSGAIGSIVTIVGSNFNVTHPLRPIFEVKFNGIVGVVQTNSATSIRVKVPAGATTGPISVETGGGVATSAINFTIVPDVLGGVPSITSFNPIMGVAGAATPIYIYGNNFSTIPENNIVNFGSQAATVTSASGDGKTLVVLVPLGATTGPITVQTASGSAVSANNFVIGDPLAPTITSFVPASGPVGTRVTIYGTNFGPTIATNSVRFNGTFGQVLSGGVNGYIWATVPAGASSGLIAVSTTKGTAVSSTSFTVDAPVPPTVNTVAISPAALSFGSITVGNGSRLGVTLTNTGTTSLKISGASVSGSADFTFQLNGCYGYNNMLIAYDTLAPGMSCPFEFLFYPTWAGSSSATFSFTSSGKQHTVNLSGVGVASLVPVASLSQSALTFGTVVPGSSSTVQTVTLSNTGTAPLNLFGITLNGEFAQSNTCGTSLAAGASCSIGVSFMPRPLSGPLMSNKKFEALNIFSNSADSPHQVLLNGTVDLGVTGQVAIYTRASYPVDSVYVDDVWVGGNIKFGAQNTCGGIGAITVTLAPGTHKVTAFDSVLTIQPANINVLAGGCAVYEIIGNSSCLAPNVLLYGNCYPPSTPACSLPQVLQGGVCITPTPAPGGTGVVTGTGKAGTFISTGAGTGAQNCISIDFRKGVGGLSDTQTIKNNCAYEVYVMRCHSPSPLPGTADTECNGASAFNLGKFYQQFHWIHPGEVQDNQYSMPPETTIWFGACSGGKNPLLPSGKEVSITGDYVCN